MLETLKRVLIAPKIEEHGGAIMEQHRITGPQGNGGGVARQRFVQMRLAMQDIGPRRVRAGVAGLAQQEAIVTGQRVVVASQVARDVRMRPPRVPVIRPCGQGRFDGGQGFVVPPGLPQCPGEVVRSVRVTGQQPCRRVEHDQRLVVPAHRPESLTVRGVGHRIVRL